MLVVNRCGGPTWVRRWRRHCAVQGIITSAGMPLPGVSLSLAGAGRTVASSTDPDGAFRVRVPAGAAFTLRAELVGFAPHVH